MKRIALCCLSVLLAVPAFAEEKSAATNPSTMDMTKMGPASRKPRDEKLVKQQIQDLYKDIEAKEKAGDMNAMLDRIDFPVFMLTDDSAGVAMGKTYTREEYVEMMKPMMESAPKDVTWTHKPNITVLSDSLVNVVDEYTMKNGKQKTTGKSVSMMIKRDGKWMWKTMTEAGWGDYAKGVGGTGSMMHEKMPGHETMPGHEKMHEQHMPKK